MGIMNMRIIIGMRINNSNEPMFKNAKSIAYTSSRG